MSYKEKMQRKTTLLGILIVALIALSNIAPVAAVYIDDFEACDDLDEITEGSENITVVTTPTQKEGDGCWYWYKVSGSSGDIELEAFTNFSNITDYFVLGWYHRVNSGTVSQYNGIWIKIKDDTTTEYIYGGVHWDLTESDYLFEIYEDDGASGNNENTTEYVSTDTWYWIELEMNNTANEFKLYADGVERCSLSTNPDFSSNPHIYISNYRQNSYLDYIRLTDELEYPPDIHTDEEEESEDENWWDDENLATLAEYIVVLSLILIPAGILGGVLRLGFWGVVIGLLIGAGLGYLIYPTLVPMWLVFAIIIGIVGIIIVGRRNR